MSHSALVWSLSVILSMTLIGCVDPVDDEKAGATMVGPLVVEFPLRGIWISPQTPGTKIPSHGMSLFGESHAIDFVMIDDPIGLKKAYSKSLFEYVIRGVPLYDFYGWGQEVHSPVDGMVLRTVNDIAERPRVNVFQDLWTRARVTKDFLNGSAPVESITGNSVLIECGSGVYALLAHLLEGSVSVKGGERVKADQVIGRLGHSGNSMMPHLHMQFMDNHDHRAAEGLPFVFREYEVWRDGDWVWVSGEVPTVDDIVRYR